MGFEWNITHDTVIGAVFMFFITLIVGGAFFFAIWCDIRARLWKQHFDRDTATAYAEIISYHEDSEEGTVAIRYRFNDEHGRSHEGSQTLFKMAVKAGLDIGVKRKVYYYRLFPGMFSYLDGYEKSFFHSMSFIGFFILALLCLGWIFYR
jgi:hypothetical protein